MSIFSWNCSKIPGCWTRVAWFVAIGIAMMPDRANACTTIERELEFFEIDPALRAVDSTPPAPLMKLSAFVYRTTDSVCYTDGTCTITDCGPSGSVILDYDREAVTEGEELGVRLRVIEGSVPEAMGKLIGAILPLHKRVVFDMEYSDVVSVNAVVTLTVVDRAGNESSESEPIMLTWTGCTMTLWGLTFDEACLDEERFDCSDDGSCVEVVACGVRAPGRAVDKGNIMASAGLFFAFLAWFARRRRRG